MRKVNVSFISFYPILKNNVVAKFADIDKTIKDLDQKLKEGTIRQLGTNKVATLTEKLISKNPPESTSPEKPVNIFYKLSIF